MDLTRTTNFKENNMDKIRELFNKFIDWHEKLHDWLEEFTDDIRWKFNLSHYQIMWIAYFEGIVTVLLFMWIF